MKKSLMTGLSVLLVFTFMNLDVVSACQSIQPRPRNPIVHIKPIPKRHFCKGFFPCCCNKDEEKEEVVEQPKEEVVEQPVEEVVEQPKEEVVEQPKEEVVEQPVEEVVEQPKEEIKEEVKEEVKEETDKTKEDKKDEMVKVPNTDANASYVVPLVGVVGLLFGAYKVFKK